MTKINTSQPKNIISSSSSQTNKFNGLIPDLIQSALASPLNYRLAACIVKGKKKIMPNKCNTHGNGYGGSRHAELRAMFSLYGSKNIQLTSNGWKVSEELKKKNNNLGILVIRVTALSPNDPTPILGNARPCQKCLEMMKSLGFHEVHYSTDEGDIISEKINHMISVHASYVAIKIEFIKKCKKNVSDDTGFHKFINKQAYYDELIRTQLPDTVREINFTYFISYNLKNVPAKYNIVHMKHTVLIMNHRNQMIKQIIII
jgi:hypothetical protein